MTAAYHHTGVFSIKNPTIESEVSWSSLLSFYTLEEQSFQQHEQKRQYYCTVEYIIIFRTFMN